MRIKIVVTFLVLVLLAGGIGIHFWFEEASAQEESPAATKTEKSTENKDRPAKIRVGVYDNRAIACAYAPSKFLSGPLEKKMKEYEKAKAEGNEKRIAELKAEGRWGQQKLHLQGFCAFPVDDLLSHVKDGLAKIAEKEDLDLIVWRYDYKSENVEIVDITDQIVALYSPTEKTLRIVKGMKKAPVLSIRTVLEHGDDH